MLDKVMVIKKVLPLSYCWLMVLLVMLIPTKTLLAQDESAQNRQSTSTIFEFLFKGGIRYHHATNIGSALYNFRLPLELELLFAVAPQLHLGGALGVILGVDNVTQPQPLLATNGIIVNLPLYVTLRYHFTSDIALQPYAGAIFNLTGSEPLYHFTVGTQFLWGLILLDVGYILNISALTAEDALLPHSFRAGIMVMIPLVLVPLEDPG